MVEQISRHSPPIHLSTYLPEKQYLCYLKVKKSRNKIYFPAGPKSKKYTGYHIDHPIIYSSSFWSGYKFVFHGVWRSVTNIIDDFELWLFVTRAPMSFSIPQLFYIYEQLLHIQFTLYDTENTFRTLSLVPFLPTKSVEVWNLY